MIRLRGVQKFFGQHCAVQGLDLEVSTGEIFGLLGHNGAGKSTAIGMMLGQVWPTAGTIQVCGHDVVTQRQFALQKVGAIFEAPVFYDYLSGWRNLEILSHYTAPTSPQRIREVIDWVGLTGREKAKVKTYSHGMRTRLALAQALLPRPELLILDEPSDGLDPEGIHEMRLTIQRLHREMGLTILLSSHLLNEVELLCSRIAVMNKGQKVYEGPLPSVTTSHTWMKLRVNDFEAAIKLLRSEKLISDARDGAFIALPEKIGSDQIVRCLVQSNMSVFEITPHVETLEDFYLSLMKSSKTSNRVDQQMQQQLNPSPH